jgi:hypothetical protein
MKIMGQHLVIFSIENPCISLTLFFPNHLGITKTHMKIMGQHLVIISRSAALRDFRRRPRSVRISVRLYFIMSERLIDATSILARQLEAPPVYRCVIAQLSVRE